MIKSKDIKISKKVDICKNYRKLLYHECWDQDDEKIMGSRELFHDPIAFVDKYSV